MWGKSLLEYVRILKYFFLLVFAIGIIQLFYSNTLFALLKFVVIFYAGFYVVKNFKFNLKQAAISGFLLYLIVIWLQPTFSGLSIITIGVTLIDFIIASCAAWVGGLIAKGLNK